MALDPTVDKLGIRTMHRFTISGRRLINLIFDIASDRSSSIQNRCDRMLARTQV